MLKTQKLKQLKTPLALGLSLLLLVGCVIKINADDRHGNISKVFGSVHIGDNKRAGDLGSVNGGIKIGDNSSAEDVSTVNGGIKVGREVKVDSLETVNGGISGGQQLAVRDGIETVNGGINIKAGSSIGDDIKTINGGITMRDTRVGDDVSTVNGDIELLGETLVSGDVIFEEQSHRRYLKDNPSTLRIDAEAQVEGSIILYQRVKLEIADGADIGDIVERF